MPAARPLLPRRRGRAEALGHDAAPAAPPAAPRRLPSPLSPRLLTVGAVAERLAVSPRHVRRLVAGGALPVHRIGRAVRVGEDDLARFLAAARES